MPSTPELSVKSFAQLSNFELYAMLKLRSDVFVVEQNCVYPDLDDKDLHADTQHLLSFNGDVLVGYARCLAPGLSYTDAASVGRVVVAGAARGHGLATTIMQAALTTCHQQWPENDIVIGAQTYLQDFYTRLGFSPISPAYDEDGIMHIDMRFGG
jgi:ElaA protein